VLDPNQGKPTSQLTSGFNSNLGYGGWVNADGSSFDGNNQKPINRFGGIYPAGNQYDSASVGNYQGPVSQPQQRDFRTQRGTTSANQNGQRSNPGPSQPLSGGVSTRTLRNRRRRQRQRANRLSNGSNQQTAASGGGNRNKSGTRARTTKEPDQQTRSTTQAVKSLEDRIKQLQSLIDKSAGVLNNQPTLLDPIGTQNQQGRDYDVNGTLIKKPLFTTLEDKARLMKSIIFPELGDPQRLPGMGLTAVSKYWKSFNLTPDASGNALVSLSPRDFNSDANWLIYQKGNDLAATAVPDSTPYQNGDVVERARVTSAALVVRCINPSSQNASGVIACSFQPRSRLLADNISQRDIEQAVTSYNGSMAGVETVGKAVWMPMDATDMAFSTSGHAPENRSFLAAYISNSNTNTTFRVDVYINFEYIPGKNIEDVVTVETPRITDAHMTDVLQTTAKVVNNKSSSFLNNSASLIKKLGLFEGLGDSVKNFTSKATKAAVDTSLGAIMNYFAPGSGSLASSLNLSGNLEDLLNQTY